LAVISAFTSDFSNMLASKLCCQNYTSVCKDGTSWVWTSLFGRIFVKL